MATARTRPELSLDVADLHLLLADLVETAASDDTLPMLCGVLLHTDTTPTGQRVLVGTSTDRFVLGQAHTPATGDLPATFVPLPGVWTMLAALDTWWAHNLPDTDSGHAHPQSPWRPTGVTVRLVHDGPTLTLTVPTTRPGVGAATVVRVAVDHGIEFPTRPLVRLLTEPTTEPTTGSAAAATVGLVPEVWHLLGRIAERRDTAITLTTPPTTRALRVHIGDQYRALVMPLRPDRMCPPPPVFLLTGHATRTRVED